MRIPRRTITAAALLYLCASISAQESISPQEVHFIEGVYTPPSLFALRTETRLVEIDAVVRDRQGHPAAGLTKGDFQILDEGKSREISAFSVLLGPALPGVAKAEPPPSATPAPTPAGSSSEKAASRSIALFFDDINAYAGEFAQAKAAASKLVRESLAPSRAAIFLSSGYQDLAFTGDGALLAAEIDKLNARMRPVATTSCPVLTPYLAYRILFNMDLVTLNAKVEELRHCQGQPPVRRPALVDPDNQDAITVKRMARMVWQEQEPITRSTLDALKSAIVRLSAQPAPRVLLLASSGFLAGGPLEEQNQSVISLALRVGVTINAIDAKGLYTTEAPIQARTPIGRQTGIAAIFTQSQGSQPQETASDSLSILADSTGGRFFHNSNDLAGGFLELAAIPAVSYLLGFVPPEPSEAALHKLKVRVPGHDGLTIEARPAYFAEKSDAGKAREERPIDREVFTETASRNPALGVKVDMQPGESGAVRLRAIFSLDVGLMTLVKTAGLEKETVSFLVVLLDEQGHFVSGKEGATEFALKPATRAQLSGKRLSATLELDATPGKYRLRVIAQEHNQGAMTAASQMVELK